MMAEKKLQMALSQTSVLKVYHTVIEDVISSVRDAFLDEGVDEQVLQEMKQIWRTKLLASKAVELNPDPPEPHPPQIVVNNPKPSKAAVAKAKKAAAAAAAANTTTLVDVKPNINTLQAIVNNTGNGILANNTTTGTTGIVNGIIKKEPQQHQSNPPPLHPTSGAAAAALLHKNVQQQQQAQAGSNSQTTSSSTIPIVASLDPNRIMPVNITLPAQPGTANAESRVLTIHVPASALQENQLTQILTAHLISSIMSLPSTLASSVLQQHVNAALNSANMQKNIALSKQVDGDDGACCSHKVSKGKKSRNITIEFIAVNKQVDGPLETSDEEESEESDDVMDNDDDDDLDKEDDDEIDNEGGAEEEPLNSGDDVSDDDAHDLFDTDNVIVCQYDKITRSRNKWKFYLKDGIMNLGGKDYVFQKSNGDAEW